MLLVFLDQILFFRQSPQLVGEPVVVSVRHLALQVRLAVLVVVTAPPALVTPRLRLPVQELLGKEITAA